MPEPYASHDASEIEPNNAVYCPIFHNDLLPSTRINLQDDRGKVANYGKLRRLLQYCTFQELVIKRVRS